MKRLKNLLFTMLLALLAWNCQKEEVSVQDPESFVETESKPFDGLRTIALEEVPDIEGFLSSSLSKRKGYAFKKDNGDSSGMVVTPFGQIPLEDILEVTDTLGNFNYTFRILPNSYIGNRFYNLVIHKKEGEKGVSAFVVEYAMDAGYAQDYMAKTAHFGQFSGKVRTYGFEAFLDKQDKRAIASKACEEEDSPFGLEPCEEYELENGDNGEPDDDLPPPNDPVDDSPQDGPGDGGGNGNLDGDGPGGGIEPGPGPGVMCTPGGLYVSDCGGSNSDVIHAAGLCQGPNKMGGNFYMQYNCSDGSTNYQDLKAGDCSDGGAGPVGIAPVSFNFLPFALGLDFAQQQWLEANCGLKNELYQFLNAHLDEQGEWREDAKDFAREALDARMEDEEVVLNEKFLDFMLEENPLLLLQIDCNQIQQWQSLAQHTAPQSVQNKINNLPGNWANDFEIQPLDEANGTVVNLDYFSVNVTQLPDNPNTEQPFTPSGFLDYIRRNFNDFVDDSTFDPYCEIPSMCQTETELWFSNDPLGSIVYIDIPLDDGVVVCTEYTNSYWYFMTMNAPFAGNHPVSGTRQFGYEQTPNGSYNFFVRGVDRFDSNIAENAAYMYDAIFGDGDTPNPFNGADALWESFQERLNNFVNNPNNGGSATIITPTKNRPDWEKVHDVLQGTSPISDLGCN